MAASVLKQDPNTPNVQKNAIIMSTFFQALHGGKNNTAQPKTDK